ncbi:MAG: hypothetical protein ABIQ57_17975, partial [Candidatus Kapaibacterium sp.]
MNHLKRGLTAADALHGIDPEGGVLSWYPAEADRRADLWATDVVSQFPGEIAVETDVEELDSIVGIRPFIDIPKISIRRLDKLTDSIGVAVVEEAEELGFRGSNTDSSTSAPLVISIVRIL